MLGLVLRQQPCDLNRASQFFWGVGADMNCVVYHGDELSRRDIRGGVMLSLCRWFSCLFEQTWSGVTTTQMATRCPICTSSTWLSPPMKWSSQIALSSARSNCPVSKTLLVLLSPCCFFSPSCGAILSERSPFFQLCFRMNFTFVETLPVIRSRGSILPSTRRTDSKIATVN